MPDPLVPFQYMYNNAKIVSSTRANQNPIAGNPNLILSKNTSKQDVIAIPIRYKSERLAQVQNVVSPVHAIQTYVFPL